MDTEASKEPSPPPSYETEGPEGACSNPEDTEESKEPSPFVEEITVPSNTKEYELPSEVRNR